MNNKRKSPLPHIRPQSIRTGFAYAASSSLVTTLQYPTKLCVILSAKGKCVPVHHATEAYWGNGSTVPRILNLGTWWRWVVSFTLWPLHLQRKNLWYPLDRSVGGPRAALDALVKKKIPSQRFGEDGGNMDLWNGGHLQQIYTTQRNLNLHRRENLKSRILTLHFSLWTVNYLPTYLPTCFLILSLMLESDGSMPLTHKFTTGPNIEPVHFITQSVFPSS